MFADHTLTPKEATRLCALGILAEEAIPYASLASAVRHLISRVAGPSIDLMGSSIELLKFEGLVTPIDGIGIEDNATLAITDKGRQELQTLLTAKLRSGASELNKLIVTLKFRFLHLLAREAQLDQVDLLTEACETELVALTDLRAAHADRPGHLVDWLDHTLDEADKRLVWLKAFKKRI